MLKRILKKKVGFGKLGLPMWMVGIAGMAIVAAAGQAVGPVLSGSVQGSAAVTAEQAVVLSSSSTESFIGEGLAGATSSGTSTDPGGDATGLVVVNDEGTSFTAAVETFVGQTDVGIHLDVDNESNDTASAVLELNVPAGLDVEVAPEVADDILEAQLSASTWLLEIPDSPGDGITITVEPKDDAKPGHYNISGRIVQIGG